MQVLQIAESTVFGAAQSGMSQQGNLMNVLFRDPTSPIQSKYVISDLFEPVC